MIITLNKASELDKIVNSHKQVLIDCFTTWCGPCKMQGPELETINQKYNDLTIVSIDIEKFPDIAKKFQIMAVPTIIYIVDKKIKYNNAGYLPAIQLEKIIKEN